MNITMTQEEKKILFKELCTRLAYGVRVKVECTTANGEKIEDEGVLNSIFINEFGTIYVCVDEVEYELEDVKPYLRPMSSMTEEEKKEYQSLCEIHFDCDADANFMAYYFDTVESFDWLNKKMFDYRGLIPAVAAIEIDEKNNPYKE